MQPEVTNGFLHDSIGITQGNSIFFSSINKPPSEAVLHLLMLVDYERKERLVSAFSKNLTWILPALIFAPKRKLTLAVPI